MSRGAELYPTASGGKECKNVVTLTTRDDDFQGFEEITCKQGIYVKHFVYNSVDHDTFARYSQLSRQCSIQTIRHPHSLCSATIDTISS